MWLIMLLILKLCNPQAIESTIFSKANLWHLNLSLTIQHFFIPPKACSTLILTPEIRLSSFFSTVMNSFPLGFILGMHILTPSGLCSMKPVSCQSLIPLGRGRCFSSQIFLSWTWPSYLELTHTIQRLLLYNKLFFMILVFYHYSIQTAWLHPNGVE